MYSKERMALALSHKEPDRVPLDMGGSLVSGITGPAYENLLRFNGRSDDIELAEIAYLTVLPIDDFQIAMGVDVLGIYPENYSAYKFILHDDAEKYWFIDPWGTKMTKPKDSGMFYDFTEFPLSNATIDDLDRYPFPDPTDKKRTEGIADRAEFIRTNYDQYTMMGSNGYCMGLLQTLEFTMGFEEVFIRLAIDEVFIETYLDLLVEKDILFWDNYLTRWPDNLDVIIYTDDFGFQEGLLISIEMFRKYFKKRYSEIFNAIRKKAPNVKILFHTCGAIYDLIPDLIEMGIDILNPIQVSCRGMDIADIKKNFGKDLVLWGGGIDTQKILPFGTEQEIRDSVKKTIDILAPGGGFVFNTVHTIQPEVPPQNIMAMIETLNEYGKY